MAAAGSINWKLSAALVLGSNIGTTIDAVLSSIGASTNAKRAAAVHVGFNICGTIIAVICFNPFLSLVDLIVPGTPESNITNHIAMLHTVFNILSAIIILSRSLKTFLFLLMKTTLQFMCFFPKEVHRMINLLETGTYFQALFMSVLFLEAVINVCCIPNLFLRDYKLLTKMLTVLFNLAGFALLVVLTTGINAFIFSRDIPYPSILLLENAEYSLVYILANFAFLVFLGIGEIRYRKNQRCKGCRQERY